ncbi:MAG TPA: mannose-6-phosphate isomerase [Paludibacteraceae bacterium]|nr:mannose-6-phosphate isomerase [Paludibacteraceae bacterium]HOU67005.1 mannose-6-phosphate isomerase [Paludibacteraceae bacterium]HPH62082.1 mannose-6-phosphate isomerase [Paludibacteraceae bacterium]HQF49208.1 mannose-6-phosphate isomerase [Paludibacteraceae bacterium]HQJ89406.1 mannose-6-phosphate isomerase [Paludibacteraceae bacterium]
MYLLKFEPILKEVIWGGEQLCYFKDILPRRKSIGESWEISTVQNLLSVVSDGEFAGMTLVDLIKQEKANLLGKKIYSEDSDTLPLLFKFMNTKDKCSVQVHPNDEQAMCMHQCKGKTEMWYIIDAEPGAELISGFSKEMSEAECRKAIAEGTLNDVLMHHKVKAGDVFYIPAGRIHALGGGLLLSEIQQSSDVTYRVYDYNRKDAQGGMRQLHVDEAMAVLNFSYVPKERMCKSVATDMSESVSLIESPYFKVNLLQIKSDREMDYSKLDSFVVYMCTKGSCLLSADGGEFVSLKQGESLLIPACMNQLRIKSASEETKILETYVD